MDKIKLEYMKFQIITEIRATLIGYLNHWVILGEGITLWSGHLIQNYRDCMTNALLETNEGTIYIRKRTLKWPGLLVGGSKKDLYSAIWHQLAHSYVHINIQIGQTSRLTFDVTDRCELRRSRIKLIN